MDHFQRTLLENQIAIMWALIVDIPDREIKKDLEDRIKATELTIKMMS